MAKSSVMLSLPQMVDLALNCPEVGAVNFNILHSLLHVLIQQVDLLECKVEFRGDDSERVQGIMATSRPGPTINLTEYIVTPGQDQRKVIQKKAKYKKVRKEGDKRSSKDEVVVEQELRVIEQRKDSKEEPIPHPAPMLSADKLESTSMQTVVVVEPADGNTTTPHVSVALSRVHFDTMEEELEQLKEEIKELKELPANMGLIEAIRNSSAEKSSPVLDMFQILTLVKRVDATETGIGKLASMLEDLAREQSTLAATGGRVSVDVVRRASDLQETVKGGKSGGGSITMSGDVKEKIEKLEKRVDKLESDTKGIVENVPKGSGGRVGSGGVGVGIGGGGGATVDEGVGGGAQTAETGVGGVAGAGGMAGVAGTDASPEQRLTDLENKFAEYTEQISTLDTMYNTQINVLQTQFTDLEKEIGEIVERINAGFPGGDTGGADQNVSDLYNKIVQLQQDMEQMTTTATKLLADKEERQNSMDVMLEQIELLKTIKANREDLEDALADKADACAVNRKVSHDQFDAACDDLARGIEDALLKLTQQERLWQQALDDIQREIETKLDKMELTPLRDFVHNKLKMLQERLKALAALKKETEAAGTKSRFLRNVNCISCDKDVIMRKQMDPTLLPPPPALPATKSIAPYLAYELDALRKQQKCMPHSRNMNHFEIAMTGGKGKGDDDHICNRYCGGSHTVTTPQQRVARLGHFIQQWGPETEPVNEGTIRGTDGQMYKAREGGDITPGRAGLPPVEEERENFPSVASRPSMVVHGGILATRSAMRSGTSKISEEEPSPSTKGPEPQESQKRPSTPQEQRVSISAHRKESQRVSISAGPRSSRDSKRTSRSSAGRASQARASVPKQSSKASVKEEVTEGGEAAAAEPEAAPPAEAEHPEGDAAEPPAEGEPAPPAEEAAPAEGEAEPAPEAEAAPAEE